MQGATVVQPLALPRCKPALEAVRILMVDFASTQAWMKEVTPPVSGEGCQAKHVVAKPLSASPKLTTNGVDKMYCQLVEIHAIATMQLVECTC
jgi:hypothetical protein